MTIVTREVLVETRRKMAEIRMKFRKFGETFFQEELLFVWKFLPIKLWSISHRSGTLMILPSTRVIFAPSILGLLCEVSISKDKWKSAPCSLHLKISYSQEFYMQIYGLDSNAGRLYSGDMRHLPIFICGMLQLLYSACGIQPLLTVVCGTFSIYFHCFLLLFSPIQWSYALYQFNTMIKK